MEEDTTPVRLFHYQTTTNHMRVKINLTNHTFSFLLEGEKELISDNEVVSVRDSHFIVMKSGHCMMTERLSAENQNYESMLLFFSRTAMLDFIQKHQIVVPHASPAKIVQAFPYDDFTASFVRSLVDVFKLPLQTQAKLLPVKFEEIMLYLCEHIGTDFLRFLTIGSDDQTSRFIQVVENNKFEKLSLQELAFLSNMSVSTFKREFRKHFRESPSKWFQDQRLTYSAFLLRDKALRPTDIFEDVGYENLSNFINAFKRKYGVTPKQYQTK